MPDEKTVVLLISVFGLSNQNTIQGRTRVQKLICDLQYEKKFPLKFNFRSYFYGPYSEDLAELVSDLVGLKILDENRIPLDYTRTRYDYRLSEEGKPLFERIHKKLKEDDPTLLTELTKSVNELEEVPTPILIDMAKEASQMPSTS